MKQLLRSISLVVISVMGPLQGAATQGQGAGPGGAAGVAPVVVVPVPAVTQKSMLENMPAIILAIWSGALQASTLAREIHNDATLIGQVPLGITFIGSRSPEALDAAATAIIRAIKLIYEVEQADFYGAWSKAPIVGHESPYMRFSQWRALIRHEALPLLGTSAAAIMNRHGPGYEAYKNRLLPLFRSLAQKSGDPSLKRAYNSVIGESATALAASAVTAGPGPAAPAAAAPGPLPVPAPGPGAAPAGGH